MAGPNGRRGRGLSRGGLAARTQTNPETVRYYERIGLLHEPARTAGGHRSYGDADVRRLHFIRRSRELGFTIAEVGELLALVDGSAFPCAEVKGLTLRHAADIRDKIADLKKIEATLTDMAARCTGNAVPECAIVDVLSDVEQGPASVA